MRSDDDSSLLIMKSSTPRAPTITPNLAPVSPPSASQQVQPGISNSRAKLLTGTLRADNKANSDKLTLSGFDRDLPPHLAQRNKQSRIWRTTEESSPHPQNQANRNSTRADIWRRFIFPHLGVPPSPRNTSSLSESLKSRNRPELTGRIPRPGTSKSIPVSENTRDASPSISSGKVDLGGCSEDVDIISSSIADVSISHKTDEAKEEQIQEVDYDKSEFSMKTYIPPFRRALAQMILEQSTASAQADSIVSRAPSPNPSISSYRSRASYTSSASTIRTITTMSNMSNINHRQTNDRYLPISHIRTERNVGPGKRENRIPSLSIIKTFLIGLGDLIYEIDLRQLAVGVGVKDKAGIENLEVVGSYKWVPGEEGVATIAVPAIPDMWDPPSQIGQLIPDSEIANYTEHRHYIKTIVPPNLHTLEPLFLSLSDPSILRSTDIVTTRNSLRQLYYAINSTGMSDGEGMAWRIDIDIIDKLILFSKVDMDDTQLSDNQSELESVNQEVQQQPKGYHLSFYETTNKRILEGSDRTTGCKWINRYTFGGLSIIVSSDVHSFQPTETERLQYSVDQFDPFDLSETSKYNSNASNVKDSKEAKDEDEENENEIVELTTHMSGLDFDDPIFNGQCIKIKKTNLSTNNTSLPDQSSLLTIKTRANAKEVDLGFYFPQLYFAQNFKNSSIQQYKLNEGALKKIQEKQQETLDKVADLLKKIVSICKELKDDSGDRVKLSIIWDGLRLKLFRRNQEAQFSEGVIDMIRNNRR